jgi:hypothetical protein
MFGVDRVGSDRHPSWLRRNSSDLQTLAGTATATSILRSAKHEHRSCDHLHPITFGAVRTVSATIRV